MIKLSAVVTCFNNEDTIVECIESLGFADEIIVLDSFSTDQTLELLRPLTCIVHQQNFKGFSAQKQDAINLTNNDWVILLDSDEFLSKDAQDKIIAWKQKAPSVDGYVLPRREWVFWQWSHRFVHRNKFLRLFDKNKALMSDDLVHESIQTKGKVVGLNAEIKHMGETSIAKKYEKITHYSKLSAQQKYQQGKSVSKVKLMLYPVWYFFKQFIIRRQIFNGVAGLINAKINTQYAYLKYAQLYELQKQESKK